MIQTTNHEEIYKELFRERKEKKHGAVTRVANKFDVTRQAIYYIVHKMENWQGRDMKQQKLSALWEKKYKSRFLKASVGSQRDLNRLFQAMTDEGFSIRLIAKLTEKHRSFVHRNLK